MPPPIPTLALPSGQRIPRLGLGTWGMGERPAEASREVRALQQGIDLGMTLIDTAEMYGSGGAEEVVAEAMAGRRDEIFLVSKVMPHNASRQGTISACEASLRRLGTERIDLFLLHWPGVHPLAETLEAFLELQRSGKIGAWGVSNLDLEDCEELVALPGGEAVATNQLLYNLSRRGIEADLLPWCRSRAIPIMAYSPLEQGRLLGERVLEQVAERHGATGAQVALAWLLQQEGVLTIPKAASLPHLQENLGALQLRLEAADLADLDQAFPPPSGPQPLEML